MATVAQPRLRLRQHLRLIVRLRLPDRDNLSWRQAATDRCRQCARKVHHRRSICDADCSSAVSRVALLAPL